MSLSKEKQEALTELYRGKDLYDPSKDEAQNTAEFDIPHMMAEGGYCMAHGGYCMSQGGGVGGIGFSEGGPVKGQKKIEKVMGEFGSGKLKSSSGDKVKDRDQAIAIALSEAGMSNKKAYGGPVGYADGGDVPDDGPIFSTLGMPSTGDDFSVAESSGTAKQNGNIALPKYLEQAAAPLKNTPDDLPSASETANALSKVSSATPAEEADDGIAPSIGGAPVPASAPVASIANKLSPDQIDQLIASLKPTTGQKIGLGATQGLATLADSIIQGVGRAGPSNISKNIEEMRQNRQQNLINALKAKYENQFRGQELGQGQQRLTQEAAQNKAANALRAKEIAETEKERQTQASNLKFQQEKAGSEQSLQKQKAVEEAAAKSAELGQQSRGWFSKVLGLDSPEAIAAQKTLQGQIRQSNGSASNHLQAINWAKANPNDPRAAKILQTAQSKLNGQ